MPAPTPTGFEAFAALPRLIAARIREQCRADATVGFEVLTEDQADLAARWRNALVAGSGLTALVLVHDCDLGEQPEMVMPKIAVHIDESVLQNQSQAVGTRIPARQLAWMVYGALLRWAPAGWSVLLPDGGPKLSAIGADPDNNILSRVSYEVHFQTFIELAFTPAHN